MPDLVPIKIKVTTNAKGYFIYPQFKKKMQFFKDNPDYHTLPLYYDKSSDCQKETDDSPMGMRWCMKLVPNDFAKEAIQKFPQAVFEMTEKEAEAFYNDRVMAHISENTYDNDYLQGLKLEFDLRVTLKHDLTKIRSKMEEALDPDNGKPGIKKNKCKTWSDMIKDKKVKICKMKEF